MELGENQYGDGDVTSGCSDGVSRNHLKLCFLECGERVDCNRDSEIHAVYGGCLVDWRMPLE